MRGLYKYISILDVGDRRGGASRPLVAALCRFPHLPGTLAFFGYFVGRRLQVRFGLRVVYREVVLFALRLKFALTITASPR